MKKVVVFGALFVFLFTGCGVLKSVKDFFVIPGEWSDNYALDLHGGRAECSEWIDGSNYTGAKTKPLPIGKEDKNWREKEKYTQATVTLKEPKRINKIKILSRDLNNVLGGMEAIVEYMDEKGNWQILKEYDERNIPKNIIVGTDIFTDKVRLKLHRPSAMFSGGGGAGGGAALDDKGERTITEFELYGKVQKPKSKAQKKPQK